MCQACEQTLTIEEVLQITVRNLKSISIPVELSDSVGVKICGSIQNLMNCLDAFERERMERAEQATEEIVDEEIEPQEGVGTDE